MGLIGAELPAYSRATAMPDLSRICDCTTAHGNTRILNPLSEVRDQTCNLMVPGWIHFGCATTGTPQNPLLKNSTLTFHNQAEETS